MTRAKIEAMKLIGIGWDTELPGLIADSFWKMYEDVDGTGFAVLDKQEKYKTGNSSKGIAWEAWKELDT